MSPEGEEMLEQMLAQMRAWGAWEGGRGQMLQQMLEQMHARGAWEVGGGAMLEQMLDHKIAMRMSAKIPCVNGQNVHTGRKQARWEVLRCAPGRGSHNGA